MFAISDVGVLDEIVAGDRSDFLLARGQRALVPGFQDTRVVGRGERDGKGRDILVAHPDAAGSLGGCARGGEGGDPVPGHGVDAVDIDRFILVLLAKGNRVESEHTVGGPQVDRSTGGPVSGAVRIMVSDDLRLFEDRGERVIVGIHHEEALDRGHPELSFFIFRDRADVPGQQSVSAGEIPETEFPGTGICHEQAGFLGRHPHVVPAVLEERGDGGGPRKTLLPVQVTRGRRDAFHQPDAGAFRSHPEPACVVLEQRPDRDPADVIDPSEGLCSRLQPVQTVFRSCQDGAAVHLKEAGNPVVREVDLLQNLPGCLVAAVQAAVGRNPQDVVLRQDIQDPGAASAQGESRKGLRGRVEAVQSAFLRAHPDGAGCVRPDALDDSSFHGLRSFHLIIEVVCIAAVMPEIDSPVV